MFNLVRNQTPNKIYVLELIKRRSKVHQKNVSRERPVNLVYKIIIIVASDFSASSFKLKRGILPPLTR